METKVCSVCGNEKPLKDFPSKNHSKCKVCMSIEAKDRAERQKQLKKEYEERMSILDDFTSEELLKTLYDRGYRGDLIINSDNLQHSEFIGRCRRKMRQMR